MFCAAAYSTAVLTVLTGCSAWQATLPRMSPFLLPPKATVLWTESFDTLKAELWREVEVRGRTRYKAATLDGRACLQARSQAGASILVNAVQFDTDVYEWLSWEWRVDQLVAHEDLARKDGSDAAARVYVYFETKGLPWQKRSIDYVWSAALPVGTMLASAYSPQSKIIVVESGTSALGQWRVVERNLEDDYERCFGGDPPDVIAIGLMSDTDNTGDEALAYFDELRVSRRAAAERMMR